jgi:hypothetical protein
MKKIILLLSFISFATISSAQINNRNFFKGIEILSDTTKLINGENPEYNAFLKKNSKYINAEVFQVIEDSDTLSYCLVKVYKDSKVDYDIAMLETVDEIVYEGKEFENKSLFLQEFHENIMCLSDFILMVGERQR